ncbi:MAG: hypothetical protein HC922_07515 [Leptolyngbyaceae cyanobacterium SM2_3_12]|nr:hypothetical protein [Leptolyngbyaceae cyanobacterium SM2_3_12]
MKTTFYWQNPHYSPAAVPSDSQAPAPPSWSARWSNLWHGWLASLDVSPEPKVWQTSDSRGQVTWNAYDAMSGQGIYQVSDQDLRVWLEDLHYQDQGHCPMSKGSAEGLLALLIRAVWLI